MGKFGLLTVHAVTSLHAGDGSAPGVVDLPIQREPHTRWPRIVGSSLKGALRGCAREYIQPTVPGLNREGANAHVDVTAVFGPLAGSPAHAGALCIADARILAFPVRATQGGFAWLTCPAVWDRLKRDLIFAHAPLHNAVMPAVSGGDALCADDAPWADGSTAGFEEFAFTVAHNAAVKSLRDEWLKPKLADESSEALKRLVVVSDEAFTFFVRRACTVVARNAMKDYDTKRVADGALFYEEMLPPETLMYSMVEAHPPRNGAPLADGVMEYLKSVLGRTSGVVQLGADATVGVGWCRTSLSKL